MKKQLLVIILFIFFAQVSNAQLYDNTFNGNGVWNAQLRNETNVLKSITIQPDGKIVFSGRTRNSGLSEKEQFMLGRLTTTGIVDNTFSGDGITEYEFSTDNANSADAVMYMNNKIYAAGNINNNGIFENIIVKYDINGALDPSLNSTGVLTSTIGGATDNTTSSLNATSDNKIVAVGYSYTTQVYLSGYKVDENGTFENSFGSSGKVLFTIPGYPIEKSCIQNDNKIIAVLADKLLRFKTNGNLDSTGFGIDGQVSLDLGTGSIRDVAVQKDGKLVLCGIDNNSDFAVYRYNTNGTVDMSFGTNGKVVVPFGGITNVASAIAIDTTSTSGKLFVTGYSYYGGTNTYVALARISPTNGDIEARAEFLPNDLKAQGKDIVLQSDGKIIIGGNSALYSVDDIFITRINQNFSTVIATGVETNSSSLVGINIFPNPSSHYVNIHSSYEIENIVVLDVIGNEVMQVNATGNTQLDISSLPRGLYNFVITTDRGVGVKKVSVQ